VDDGIVMYKRTNGGRNKAELVRNIVVQNRTSYMFVSWGASLPHWLGCTDSYLHFASILHIIELLPIDDHGSDGHR
jgi:hypothetical protein